MTINLPLFAWLVLTVLLGYGYLKYKIAAWSLAHFIAKKKYALPTDDEVKECTKAVIKELFKLKP